MFKGGFNMNAHTNKGNFVKGPPMG